MDRVMDWLVPVSISRTASSKGKRCRSSSASLAASNTTKNLDTS